MGLAEVSDILWRERELLDVLLFKLEEEQLLLAAGKARWLARATREVELVLEQIRLTELTRAVEVDAVAATLGLEPNPSLAQLADAAPPPWSDLLRAHREAFLRLTQEITSLAEANREFVTSAYHSAEAALRSLRGATADGYTATGRLQSTTRSPRLLDEAI
ncbi:MAG: flagellar protein FlgN [Acidothermus cellulolyticus]|nr:flagellar protein FlgN [Acidothermus cellulolyticus]MCL6550441.1 flagellar protein FlgN [Acidothermus cellulolyticus]